MATPPKTKSHVWMPDFFIVGAMKSGTSTLHALLAEHKKIFLANREIFYFDYDDYFEHPDFFSDATGAWFPREYGQDTGRELKWYQQHFANAAPGALIGEHSTSYLASRWAPQRIARALPDARIIVMLRDPAERTYSQYWHMVRTGRAQFNFEDSLRAMPGRFLYRSLYSEQIERYLAAFPREQICFVLFETFIKNIPAELARIHRFLGVNESAGIPQTLVKNSAQIPRYPWLRLWRNRRLWTSEFGRFSARLAGLSDASMSARPKQAWMRWLDAALERINPMEPRRPPLMRLETRRFLNRMLERENRNVESLTGLPVSAHWYRE